MCFSLCQTDTNQPIERKELAKQEGYFAPGAWQPVASNLTARTHELHIDQDNSRYNTFVRTRRESGSKLTFHNTSSIGKSLGLSLSQKPIMIINSQILGNLSQSNSGNRLKNNSTFHRNNGSNNQNAKTILNSDILGKVRTINPTTEVSQIKPKIIRFVPLSMLSSLSKLKQNISSNTHGEQSSVDTNSPKPPDPPKNNIKNISLPLVDDQESWAPISLTSKDKNTTVEDTYYKSNNSKSVGNLKKYTIVTTFGNDLNSINGTYLEHLNHSFSNVISKFNSNKNNSINTHPNRNSSVWLPVVPPAKGDSKLLGHDIEADSDLSNNTFQTSNISINSKTKISSSNGTKLPKQRVYTIKESSSSLKQNVKTTSSGNANHLIDNFLASNIQNVRTPTNSSNKRLDKIDTASSTIPVIETKRWPTDPAGTESLDDLILYHTYTESLKGKPKPSKPTLTIQHRPDGGYIGVIKKPAVTIDNSHWDYSTTSSPHDYDYRPTHPTRPSITVHEGNYHTTKPVTSGHFPNHRPSYDYNPPHHPSTTMYPVVLITPRPTPTPKPPPPVYHYDTEDVPHITNTYPTHDPHPKPSNCPNIIISTNGNVTKGHKELCPDVNIVISSGVTNNNVLVSPSTTETSIIPVYGDDPYGGGSTTVQPPVVSSDPAVSSVSSGSGILSSITNVVSNMLSPLQYPIWYFMLAPIMVIMAGGIGMAALLFPLTAGWRSARGQGRKLDKKVLSIPKPKPRRRRALYESEYLNTSTEQILQSIILTFEQNLNRAGLIDYNNSAFQNKSLNRKQIVKRKKIDHALTNYSYWWWLKSNT